MATILCVTSTVPGSLYPGTELARRLKVAGHHLTCASEPEARGIVERQGLDFLPIEASRYQGFLAADARAGNLARLWRVRSRRAQAQESLAVGNLATAVRRIDPDLIVIDGEMHEQVIALSAAGVPMVLLNSFVSIWRRPQLPPPHCLVRPGVGWRGTRIGIWLLWRAFLTRKWSRKWARKVRRVGCDRLSLLRRLAGDNGFDFRHETDGSQWLMPFTYRRLPVLSLHALEFEFPHRPPKRVRYVGPMLLEARGEGPISDAERGEIGAVLDRCRRQGRALIYAGFGSFFTTDLAFLRRLVAAVAERGDWELLISLGGRVERSALGPLPERVHAFGWLPQVEVLCHAKVAVSHGGINTVDECVLSGVPMLVYCGFETDMAGTTARVVHHGIGIAGDRQADSPRVIRERLDRLLREPGFRSNVENLRAAYASYAERRVAERAVESLIARVHPGSTT